MDNALPPPHIRLRLLEQAWPMGTMMRKKRGSNWHGSVRGYYTTDQTPMGLAIESSTELGSVQIYPVDALEKVVAGDN